MTKPKHKQPPKNFFRYFVDEYILFRRDFVIETPASVEDCAKALLALAETTPQDTKNRRLKASCRTARGLSTSMYFKVIAEQQMRQKSIYEESSVAEGTIQSDGDITLIRGKVLMSGSEGWGVIVIFGFLLLTLIVFNIIGIHKYQGEILIALVFSGLVSIFSWLQMYRDRNFLVGQIQQAIDNAESSMSKIKNEDVYNVYNYLTEAQDNSTASHAND
jgi:hypothetical protein